jgi:hypothetical protein
LAAKTSGVRLDHSGAAAPEDDNDRLEDRARAVAQEPVLDNVDDSLGEGDVEVREVLRLEHDHPRFDGGGEPRGRAGREPLSSPQATGRTAGRTSAWPIRPNSILNL